MKSALNDYSDSHTKFTEAKACMVDFFLNYFVLIWKYRGF